MSMWSKRREDERVPPLPSAPRPAPVAPSPVEVRPVEVKKETMPLATTTNMPMGRIEPDARHGSATIGKAVRIVGQIYSKEDLYVDGDVEGTIELMDHKLTIGPNGKVQAAIKAREVVTLGSVQGNVESSEKIEIRKDAKLVGDIRTARIIIEDGAYFKGSIDIVKPEPARAAAAPKTAPLVSNPAAPTAAAEGKR